MYKRLLTEKTLSVLQQMDKECTLLGTTPDDDLDVLCGLVWARRPKFILNLGTFLGYTAIVLADIVNQIHGDQGEVVTVDNNATYNKVCSQYAALAGLDEVLKTLNGYSTMLPPTQQDRPWDFIYLDTTHQYFQTRDELICLTPLCRSETVFCFHDASSHAQTLDLQQQGGVKRALREWLDKHTEWQGSIFEESGGFGKFGIGYMQRKAEGGVH